MRRLLTVLTVLAVAGCGSAVPVEKSDAEKYVELCRSRGGLLSQDVHWSNVTYACVDQTSGPQLPPLSG